MSIKQKQLIPVCIRCGLALVVNEQTGKMTCPKHGVQERYSYAVKGKDQ